MIADALDAVTRAIAALTIDEIEVEQDGEVMTAAQLDPLARSIAFDLTPAIACAEGGTRNLLVATQQAITESLIALMEAQALLEDGR